MRRSPVPVAIIVMAVLLVGVLAYALIGSNTGATLDTAVKRGERPANPAADIKLAVLGEPGQAMSIGGLGGKIVVVNIWGSWCEPCADEAPLLVALNDALVKTGEGQVLGVTHNDPSGKSLQFAKEFGLTYPSIRDVDDKIYDAFGTRFTPETFVIDQEGRVAAVARSSVTPQFLRAALTAVGAKATIPARFMDSGSS